MSTKRRSAEPSATLPSEQLSAVTFVMGDVQLHVGGPTLTAHTWPAVHVAAATYRRGDAGYHDALCARIARRVTAAALGGAGDEIIVTFDDRRGHGS
jgi:hypothetical protein